jgi:hypothetical protein
MINNRIFEGLSSGSVVLSHYSDELYNLFGDIILFSKDDSDMPTLIDDILNNPQKRQEIGKKSKDIILQRHTWDHRAIQILDLFWHLNTNSQSNNIPSSQDTYEQKKRYASRATLAWIVSDHLKAHLDYIIVIKHFLYQNLIQKYDITLISQSDWTDKITSSNHHDNDNFVSRFDVLLFFASPCDHLVSSMNSYTRRTVLGIP